MALLEETADRIVGCILAGGRSTRMGAEKSLLPLGGRPMIAHVIDRLQAAPLGGLIINANGPPDRFAAFGLKVVRDRVGGNQGPLAGLMAAFDHASALTTQADFIVTAPTDTPFLPADFVFRLRKAADGQAVILAMSSSGRHPTAALWPLKAAPPLRTFLQTCSSRKLLDFADRFGSHNVFFEDIAFGKMTVDPFLNINRKSDLEKAERLLATIRGQNHQSA